MCDAQEEWATCHPALADAAPATRVEVARTLLDYLRRELAIKVDYLHSVYQGSLRQLSSQRLREPWAMDEGEQLLRGYIAFPRSRKRGADDGNESREHLYVSGRGGFGLYQRRPNTLPVQLFAALQVAGLVQPVQEPAERDDVPGYMIPASALIWQAGDGTEPLRDVIRVPRTSSAGSRTNPYFVGFYRQPTRRLEGLRAKEHTAQVQNDQRQQREDEFRQAKLPLLFCSPTMELGVDIAQLNALNMRNVPPTPANYAQRSGRAGRSGQPALVFTYCTTGSPHDQYFFQRPQQMVAGAVTPPRLDLANEDLVRAHVHAVWLAETGQSLGSSLKDILNLEGETPTLAILPSVQASIGSANAKAQAKARLQGILATVQPELARACCANCWTTRLQLRGCDGQRSPHHPLSGGRRLYGDPLWRPGQLARSRAAPRLAVRSAAMTYAVGSLVKARGREWVVLPQSSDDFLLLRPLGGVEQEVAGVYLPLEGDDVRPATFALPDPTRPGDFLSCRLLRDAARPGVRAGAGPFRSSARLNVEPRPYQLVPLLMGLKLDPVRLLLADDVGIGKTIEAALLARELLDRGEIHRLAVLCPPHLAEQWQDELATKFNIQAELVLPSTVSRLERNTAAGLSLFDVHPLVVVSTDYIKASRRRDDFVRSCPEFVIVDEAHTCAFSLSQRAAAVAG